MKLLLSLSFLLIYHLSVSQCSILPNATTGISYSFVQNSPGNTGGGIAYNPNLNIYYAVMAGNTSFPLETFDATGNPLFQTNAAFDCRGLWWNNVLNQLETNGHAADGIYRVDLDGNGYALNSGTVIFTGQNQPWTQSVGDLDLCANEILYYRNGEISRYDRTSNALLGTHTLNGIPSAIADINVTTVVYTGCLGNEIAILNHVDRRIYFFDKSTWTYSGFSQLPAGAAANSFSNFSYANDLVWLHNPTTRTWTSYQVLDVVTSLIPIVDAGIDREACEGSPIVLSGSGALNYTWDNGVTDGSAFNPPAGTTIYTVTGTNAEGCQNTDQVSITVNPLPLINAGLDQTVCNNGTQVTLNGSGADSYTWTKGVVNGSPFNPPLGTTLYTVTGTDANGCQGTDNVTVLVNALPNVNAGPDQTVCNGEQITLNTSGSVNYW